MPRGTPDGKLSQFAYAADETDIGKTTAAIFGFSPIDGAGRIIYFDSWKNGLGAWKKLTYGGLATTPLLVDESIVTAGEIYSPPKTLKLNPGVSVNSSAYVSRELYLGRVGVIGVETSFFFNGNSPSYTLTVDYNPVGKNAKYSYVKFDRTLNQWLIYAKIGGVNGFINVFSYTPPANSMHIPVKLVADFNTGYYVRLLIGDQLIDIQQYEIGDSSSTLDGYCIFGIGAVSIGASTLSGYAGYFLATKDETESGYVVPAPIPPGPSYNIDYLLVGGGGGTGRGNGSTGGNGGGGGGGVKKLMSQVINQGINYPVVVGSGGAGFTGSNGKGANGNDSSFNSDIAHGGGGAGAGATGLNDGLNGGSGGGAGGGGAAGSGTGGEGNNGGNSTGQTGGAGGGGAGAVGANAVGIASGAGGAGVSDSITGAAVTYGGGGGATRNDAGAGSAGGAGGGGAGAANSQTGTGTAGTNGLGGGAGASGYQNKDGVNGGSGCVILRILTADYSGIYTGTPAISVDGSYTILNFSANGSYTG